MVQTARNVPTQQQDDFVCESSRFLIFCWTSLSLYIALDRRSVQRQLLKSLQRCWQDAALMDLPAFADRSGKAASLC